MFDRRQFMTASLAAAPALAFPAFAKTGVAALPRDLTAQLEKEFAKASMTSGAITVVRGGRQIGFWSHGYASKPFQAPIHERTLFHVGSVGKHMTAMGVLRLVAAGRIKLDEGVGTYVRDLPRAWGRIPIRNLLEQTSGLVDYGDFFPDWDRPQTRELVLKEAGSLPTLYSPGEAWNYCNTNYLVLGWLIEDASGQTYRDFMKDQVFGPAGLPEARTDAAQEVMPNRAEPYLFEKGVPKHAVRMDNEVSAAADGGILFSGSDWAPWSRVLNSSRLLPPSLMMQMFKPAVLNTGREIGYGFGWFLTQVRGKPFQFHSGGVPGFGTYMIRIPHEDLLVAFTFNAANGLPGMADIPLRAAEAVAPGSTYLSQQPSGAISSLRETRLRHFYMQGALEPEWIAPELEKQFRVTNAFEQPPLKAGIDALVPIEEFPVQGGVMQRYRMTVGGQDRYPIIGWTPQDRIYFIG